MKTALKNPSANCLRKFKGLQLTFQVVILSMVAVPAEIERGYALGCNVSMTKPVEETRFIEALRQLGLCMSIVQLPTGLMPVTPH
jgi:DNA-binding NarL/FixJ family response regulator